jgi:hypothetical protein
MDWDGYVHAQASARKPDCHHFAFKDRHQIAACNGHIVMVYLYAGGCGGGEQRGRSLMSVIYWGPQYGNC